MIKNLLIASKINKLNLGAPKRCATQLFRNTLPPLNIDEFVASIRTVKAENNQKLLNVTWNDGFEGKFPFVWLLDNARFSTATDAKHRLSLNELNLDAEPQHLALSQDGRCVSIRWFPYREAIYDSDWLKKYAPCPDSSAVALRRSAVTWGRSQLEPRVPCLHASDLGVNLSETHDRMNDFAKYGVLVVRGCLSVDDVLRRLNDVLSDSDADELRPLGESSPANLSESSSAGFVRGLRTAGVAASAPDSPPNTVALYVNGRPSSDDATIQLVDGFRIAEQLQDVHPSVFNDLCTMTVQYVNDRDEPSASRPVFTLSASREVTEVSFDNSLRALKLAHSPQNASRFYEALKVFHSYCYQSRNLLNLHDLQEGDVVLLDNKRVLYGYSGFSTDHNEQAALIREIYFGDILTNARWRDFV